ncbi:hypothetical protein GGR56DRAFT_512902 [Xylariaceae sp. FL0804]|nr:hypothetical protein GGR56DRAFT_512902 [Xylariaceae sp. FL0804]
MYLYALTYLPTLIFRTDVNMSLPMQATRRVSKPLLACKHTHTRPSEPFRFDLSRQEVSPVCDVLSERNVALGRPQTRALLDQHNRTALQQTRSLAPLRQVPRRSVDGVLTCHLFVPAWRVNSGRNRTVSGLAQYAPHGQSVTRSRYVVRINIASRIVWYPGGAITRRLTMPECMHTTCARRRTAKNRKNSSGGDRAGSWVHQEREVLSVLAQ